MADVRGEEDARDVAIVSFELGDGYEFGFFAVWIHSLVDTPDEHVALRIPNQ